MRERPNDYICVSVTLFDNPKLADVADECGPVAYAVWIHLLCQAKRARHLGRIIAPPVRVARLVGVDVETTRGIMQALESRRCIESIPGSEHHYQIRNWRKWQSMTAAERTRKHRDGDNPPQDVTLNVTQTPPSVTPDTPNVLTVTTGEERREEKKREETSPPPNGDGHSDSNESKPLALSKRRTLKGMTDETLEADVAGCRKALGDAAPHVDRMIAMAASENKDGRMAPTRAWREFWEPLARAVAALGLPAVRHGIIVAISKDRADGVEYAVGCARRYTPESRTPAGVGPAKERGGRVL